MLKILFEFIGGPNDGQVLKGILGEGGDAERHYLFTNHGAVGQRFKMASQYAIDGLFESWRHGEQPPNFQRHYYRVTGCLEGTNAVWVRAEYLSPNSSEQSNKSSPEARDSS